MRSQARAGLPGFFTFVAWFFQRFLNEADADGITLLPPEMRGSSHAFAKSRCRLTRKGNGANFITNLPPQVSIGQGECLQNYIDYESPGCGFESRRCNHLMQRSSTDRAGTFCTHLVALTGRLPDWSEFGSPLKQRANDRLRRRPRAGSRIRKSDQGGCCASLHRTRVRLPP